MVLPFSALGPAQYIDPAPKWRWDIVLPDLNRGRRPEVVGFEPVLQIGKPNVEACNVPMPTVPSQPKFQGGRSIKVPGFVEIEDLTLTITESAKYQFLRYFLTWQCLVVSHRGVLYGVKNDYTKDVVVRAYDILSSTTPVISFIAHCWPTQAPPLSYSYEESAAVTYDVTLAVDFITPETITGQSLPP